MSKLPSGKINQGLVLQMYSNETMNSWLREHDLGITHYSTSVEVYFSDSGDTVCCIPSNITTKYTYEVIFDMILECHGAYGIGKNTGKIEGRNKLQKDLANLLGLAKED